MQGYLRSMTVHAKAPVTGHMHNLQLPMPNLHFQMSSVQFWMCIRTCSKYHINVSRLSSHRTHIGGCNMDHC